MDNFKDIAILLIMVAVTIIGSLAKSKKRDSNTSTKPVAEKTPWEDIFSQEPEEDPMTMPESEIIKHEVTVDASDTKTLRTSALKQRAALEKSKIDDPDFDQFQDAEHIAKSFNLKQAVIYSEILKPKFDE